MVCILKNQYKAEIEDLKKIVGSEDAAYYLLCANNGYTLDKTPQGEDSALYSALSSLYQGDLKKIITAKALAYLPEMVDWVDNPEKTNLTLDLNGEPSIKYLTDTDNGPLFANTTWNSEDVSLILLDEGQLDQTLNILRDNNIINREVPIQNSVKTQRNKFVLNYLQELSKYEDITPVSKYLHSMDARDTWNRRKKDELINLMLNRLAKTWNLKLVKNGSDTYFEGDDDSIVGKLRIQLVNNILKYIEAKEDEKGAYVEDVNNELSMLYISVENGDHTTVVHELAHRYVRKFWETLPVQDALKAVQKRKDSNSIEVEERLVNKLVKALMLDESLASKFWNSINKLLSKVFSVYSNKQEILDDLVGYFAINEDIRKFQAETVFFAKIYEPVFQSGATERESKLLDEIKKLVNIRIKAFLHDPIRSNKTLAELRQLDIDLGLLNSDDPQDIIKSIRYILGACEHELRNSVAGIMAQLLLNGPDKLDVAQFAKLKTDTLGYYNNLINSKINLIFKNGSSDPELRVGSDLHKYFTHVSLMLHTYLLAYENITDQWVDWYIDQIADELIDFADKEIWKVNAKHWVRNEINDNGLGLFDKLFTSAGFLFGTINSNSPIANIVDHLVRRANNYVRPKAESVGHHLTKLFDSYTKHVNVSPFNRLRNFCELSYNRDANGRRGLTGNFRRSENWGEMLFAIAKEKKRIAKELGIELDENLRFDWRSVDRATYNAYYDALDNFYERNDIVRKFKPEYYRILRRFMSPETIETRKEILEQIDIIESGCKNLKTGIIETFRLTDQERNKLKQLKNQKKNLANPYNIVQDEKGNFISIEMKDESSFEYQMAEEIIKFNDAIRGRIRFEPDYEKYNKDRQTLIDSGAKDWEIDMWELDNTIHKIRSGVFESGGSRGFELAMLYAEKSAIIEATKPRPGHWDPNLSKLNDEAWYELKEIDLAIADYESEDGYTKPKGGINRDADIRKDDVYHYDENGILSKTQTEYQYQLEKYHNASLVNPNAMLEFEEKFHFYKTVKDDEGNTIFIGQRLTAFNMTRVDLVDGALEGEVDEPTGHYAVLDKTSGLVEPGYDESFSAYILPQKNGKWHDAEFEKLYGDGTTEYAKLYDEMIRVMGEIYSNYGMNDVNKYQLPGIRDDFLHSLHRRGYISVDNIKQAININESDINYNEEVSIRPDGTEINVVPIRWIKKLDNPNLTSTDLISTITAMYESSLNYKEKSNILPTIQMLYVKLGLDFSSVADDIKNKQLKLITSYVKLNVFGRKRVGGFGKLNKAADVFMSKAHSKLMAHNWKVVIKNAYDSFWNFNKELAGGKYFTAKDAIATDIQLAKEILLNLFRNIGRANGRTLTAAILNRNGVNGSVSELFKGLRSSGLRRFFAKHFKMGEYSLIDYVFKGNIALSIYHNHRLIENPLTGQKLFMNKWQAAYVYKKAGMSENDGVKAWSKAGNIFTGTTLLDAFYVDKEGNLTLKDKYKDIVRPNVNGRESNLLETRIETIIRERVGVINGILDEMDRPAMFLYALGAMVGQMRGWMFSQSADNFKTGTLFRVLEEDLDKFGFEANEGKNYYESDEYRGAIANISTGFVEAGAQRHLITSYCRCFFGLFRLYKITNKIKKPTRQDKYRANMMSVSLLSMATTIALSIVFGKMVEDDPDKWFPNFAYAINSGAMSERVSQMPFGVFVSMLELIRSPFVGTALYQDAGSVIDLISDAAEYYRYKHGWENDPHFDDIIKRGGYSANLPILDVPMENWMRDAMKASSVLFPDYSVNNIFKNLSNASNISSANFYNDQFPVNVFNYRPDRGRGRSKSNWVTDVLSGKVSRILNLEGNPYVDDDE